MKTLGRCECCNPDCPGSLREKTDGPREACRDEATHVVTVGGPKANESGYIESNGFGQPARIEVPMCAPCAAYHEARQKAGAR